MSTRHFRNWLMAIALLALLVGLAFQGSRGLYETTEGRYSLCAWEMVKSHNWLEPTLAGQPHWTKPPFAYWSIAVGIQALGRNAWGARVPNALAFVATVVLVGLLGRRLWDGKTGILAALVYATSPYPGIVASTVNTDTVLALWELAAVFAFWCGNSASSPQASRRWIFFMWCMFGLGFLTKGPPALLPLPAMVVYQWLTPPEKHTARLWRWPGLLAFLVLGLGWYVAMVIRHPQLTSYFIGDEIVNRVASDKFGRNPEWYQPFTLYLPLLLLGGGLWGYYPVRFLGTWRWWRPETWRQLRRGTSPDLFLVLWMALPLAVFCVSKSRLPNYVVPLFPVTVLVTARFAVRTWREETLPRRLAWLAALSACGVILFKGLAGYTPEVAQQLLRFEKPEAVQKLGQRLVRRSKADASRLYRLCQPWDDPATTRFVLYEQERFFGFDVYARSPVARAMEEPPVTVHPRHLPQVLQEITDRSVPQTRHVFICRDYTISSFRQRLDQAGLHADDVASDAFWHLLVVSAP